MLELPDVRQKKAHDCGVATAACILRVVGFRCPYREVEKLLLTSGIDGVDPRQLETFFRTRCNLSVIAGEMDHRSLKYFTNRGWPVAAVVKDHWVVVAGMSRGIIYYHDPETGPGKSRWESFADWWSDEDRMGGSYRQWGIAVWRGK